jgi:hypothetical protein
LSISTTPSPPQQGDAGQGMSRVFSPRPGHRDPRPQALAIPNPRFLIAW